MKHSNFLFFLLLLAGFFVSTSSCKEGDAGTSSAPTSAPHEQAHDPTGEGEASSPRVATSSDWCGGHGVPESMCTVCNPALADHFQREGDWCQEHGFPESVCPVCNPMEPPAEAGSPSRGNAADWCGGHGVPESMCTQCNPGLAAGYRESGDWCGEHGLPESQCLICNPDLKIERPPRSGETSP